MQSSTNSDNSGSQENLSTSQKITDDLRAKTQSIYEVDESRSDEDPPQSGGAAQRSKNDENGSGSTADAVADERPGVLRSQSQYTIPVTANE